MHRGDIRPFHTRQVSVKHCKPFKGEITAEEIIDPIMLSRFLDDLGVNNDAEIVSEIDSDSTTITSTDSDDSSHHSSDSSRTPPPPGGGGGGGGGGPMPILPRYDDPDPDIPDPPPDRHENPEARGFHVNNPEIERFIDNLDMSEKDKDLLRQYCQIKDEMEEFESIKASRRLDQIKDFIQSADPAVREKAERELQQILSDMDYVEQRGMLDRRSEDYKALIQGNASKQEEKDNSDEVKSEESSLKDEPIQAVLDPAPLPDDPAENVSVAGSELSILDLDFEDALSDDSHASDLTWDPRHDLDPPVHQLGGPDININLPNLNINIRQPQATVIDPFARAPTIARSPAGAARQSPKASGSKPVAGTSRLAETPEKRGKHRNVDDWLVQSPQHLGDPPEDLRSEVGNPVVAPVVTKSGRLSKPVTKFDPTLESKMHKDLRVAMRRSLTSVDRSKANTTVAGASRHTTAQKPAVEPEKSKQSTVKAKTVKTSIPLASKSPVLSRKSIQTLRTSSRDLRQNLEDEISQKSADAGEKPVLDDISKRSAMTVRTPVKDDISKRSNKTVRTPPPEW